jgi:benzoate 4-monooxygenase
MYLPLRIELTSDTIHHNDVAFPQADTYMPERWLSGKRASAEKYFIPFSYGPRACVGRNVAMMELLKIVANLLKRYQFELVDPNHETVLREGFLVKPTELWVRMTKREQKAQ